MSLALEDGASVARAARRLVAAEDISVRLGGKTVLSHVSFEINAGEIVTVIGPNGAGKSTLVRAVLGLQRLSGGNVLRADEISIGYVPQRIAVDPVMPLTVRRFLSLTRRATREAIAARLDEVGAAGIGERQVGDLSGGEFRRVLLARALLHDPDLLILDEPVQQVDFAGQLAIYRLIGRIRDARNCGILIVSHDLHLVMGATDRVLCINGHVCCAGEPEAVSRHPEYVAMFGPRAADQLAVYTHGHDHTHGISGEVIELKDTDA